MEQIAWLQPTAGKPLRIVLGKEAVDSRLVLRKPVRPEIEAHKFARRPHLIFDEWQGHLGRPGLAEPREREGLRFLERLDKRTPQPPMLISERLPATDGV